MRISAMRLSTLPELLRSTVPGRVACVLKLTILSATCGVSGAAKNLRGPQPEHSPQHSSEDETPRSLKHQQTGRCCQARPQLRQSRTLTSGTRPATASRGCQALFARKAGLVAKLIVVKHVLHGSGLMVDSTTRYEPGTLGWQRSNRSWTKPTKPLVAGVAPTSGLLRISAGCDVSKGKAICKRAICTRCTVDSDPFGMMSVLIAPCVTVSLLASGSVT